MENESTLSDACGTLEISGIFEKYPEYFRGTRKGQGIEEEDGHTTRLLQKTRKSLMEI